MGEKQELYRSIKRNTRCAELKLYLHKSRPIQSNSDHVHNVLNAETEGNLEQHNAGLCEQALCSKYFTKYSLISELPKSPSMPYPLLDHR